MSSSEEEREENDNNGITRMVRQSAVQKESLQGMFLAATLANCLRRSRPRTPRHRPSRKPRESTKRGRNDEEGYQSPQSVGTWREREESRPDRPERPPEKTATKRDLRSDGE